MMQPTRTFRFLTWGACLAVAAGCQTARMAVPPSLEQRADVLPCVGRQGFKWSERFTFGDYEVSNVRRGWTRRFRWEIAAFESSTARQQFEYELKTPSGATWYGQAATGVTKNDLKGDVGGGRLTLELSAEVSFVVRLTAADHSAAWMLVMGQGPRESLLTGELTDGETSLRVEGTHFLAGQRIQMADTSGYVLYERLFPMAAVEVINQGSVQLSRDVPAERRDVLAAAASALLLYRDLSGR